MSKYSAKEAEKGVLYCTVRWSNHNNNVNQFLSTHYAEEKYTDVVLACDGHIIKAHRMILAGCSPYFEMLFNTYDAKLQKSGQPMCVVLDGMGILFPTLQLILEFMYGGEIRVKKSELESLVRGGVKLKVKGLDAVKLGDKQPEKPNEVRTVIGRSELKSPQLVKLPTPTTARSPATPDVSPIRKRTIEIVRPPPVSNKVKPVAVPKSRPPVGTASVPKSQRPVPPPMTPLKAEPMEEEMLQSGPKAANGSPVKHAFGPKETVVAQRSESPAKPESPSKNATTQEEDGEESVHAQDREAKQVDSGTRQTRRSRNGNQKPVSAEPTAAETPSQPVATNEPEEMAKLPTEIPENPEAQEDLINPELAKNDDGDENGEAEAEPVTKRRVIKKPARLSDNDFVQEIKIPPMKKRKVRDSPSRKQLSEESSESATGEETTLAEPASVPKKKKGVFSVFCAEFRDKLQAENSGETNSEITKRLSTMWKNLEPSEKEKYCLPPKTVKRRSIAGSGEEK